MSVVPSSCILTCTAEAFVGSGCTSYLNLACSCNNEQLLQSAALCIESTCPADEQLAREWNQQECAAYVTTTFSAETSTITAVSHQTSAVAVGSGNSNSNSGNSNSSNNSNSVSDTSSNQSKSSINIGAIVGGGVGGLFGVLLIGIFLWWYLRAHPRHPKRKENDSYPTPENKHWKSNEPTPTPTSNPYPAYPAYPGPIIPEPTPTPTPTPYPAYPAYPGRIIPEPTPPPPPAPYPALFTYPQPLPYPNPDPTPDRNVTPTLEDPNDNVHYAPPNYESVHGHRVDNVLPVNPVPVPGPNDGPQDDLRRFADRHRSHISPELEDKLRVAHYRPSDDPSSVPESSWAEYNIGVFELRRLQEVYDSSVPLKKKTGINGEKGEHGSSSAKTSWRP